MVEICKNFIDGELRASQSTEWLDVTNPATGEVIAHLPLATENEVNEAVGSAQRAFAIWSEIPIVERAQVLFRFKQKLEEHFQELAELVVIDNGKTLAEAKGSVRRGIEVVDFATGIPSLSKGEVVEGIASGVDIEMIRQPLGVVAGFTPFNFPVMVPLWMIPIALACGNTFVLKPSERAPLAAIRLAQLFSECGAPPGTLNVVHGTRAVAEALMAHSQVRAISVVGSSPVARSVYEFAAAHGKRVQALGGAKNSLIVMPDAVMKGTVASIISSVYGCAGQRCLAGSNVIAVGSIAPLLIEELGEAAANLKMGFGLDPHTTMGPVITKQAKERASSYIESGVRDGAKLLRDGRGDKVSLYPHGYFIGPTIFDEVQPDMAIARDEIFGPVLNVMRVGNLDEAIKLTNASPFGNSASIYTTNGGAAREFRHRIAAGMLGVNLGVPAPIAFFPFSGWKGSFFGDLHVQGRDGIEFYTQRKVVTSRWL